MLEILVIRSFKKITIKLKLSLPLIIDTSLAPSPMANVTAFRLFLMSSTTFAFCSGVTRQQITDRHCNTTSKNLKTHFESESEVFVALQKVRFFQEAFCLNTSLPIDRQTISTSLVLSPLYEILYGSETLCVSRDAQLVLVVEYYHLDIVDQWILSSPVVFYRLDNI